jgi:hypothetical protein
VRFTRGRQPQRHGRSLALAPQCLLLGYVANSGLFPYSH